MYSLNIRAPHNSLSYGIVARNIIEELYKLKTKIAYFPIGQPENTGNIQLMNRLLENQKTYSYDAPSLSIWHQFALAEHISRPHFAYPIFELDNFTELEQQHLNSCDYLFVASKWAKNIVQDKTNISSVTVAPLGVDTNVFRPINIVNKRNPTIFLHIGKLEKRKGADIIIEMFNAAFEKSDNVFLYMMIANPFVDTKDYITKAKNSKLGSKIRFLDRCKTQGSVCSFMNQATCGLFPTRAEGYGLPLLEMLACGKPIITTNYSAPTEFCNQANSYLVDVDEMEVAYDGVFFKNNGTTNTGGWAKLDGPQIDNFVSHMRHIHKIKQQDGDILNKAGIETANKFSWENCGKIIHRSMFGE